jgi:hypothetical protein
LTKLTDCPFKPGFRCECLQIENPSLILQGHCEGICSASERIYNNARDVFGSNVGYSVELFKPKLQKVGA